MTEGSLLWVVAVNGVVWTGLFVYMLYLTRKIRDTEKSDG